MKLKWQGSDVPTGRYRSFERRGWPTATIGDGIAMVRLLCDDGYIPTNVKTGKHGEISIHIAFWHTDDERHVQDVGAFRWVTLVKRAASLSDAKSIAQEFLSRRTEFVERALAANKATQLTTHGQGER